MTDLLIAVKMSSGHAGDDGSEAGSEVAATWPIAPTLVRKPFPAAPRPSIGHGQGDPGTNGETIGEGRQSEVWSAFNDAEHAEVSTEVRIDA